MRFATALLFAGTLLSQQNPAVPPLVPSVRAQGTAKVSARPDEVRIDIGVISQGKTAAAASAANATLFTEVVATLKKVVGTSGDIQTVSFQVHPDYKYPREGGTPTIAGYTATNVVRVTTSRVDESGAIIDAAGEKGANTIRGIQFGVKDERKLRVQALREASQDARANAEAMAAGLGLKVTRILRIEDGGAPIVPMQREEMMMMRAAKADSSVPTPVSPGTIEVEARVTVTAEVDN